MSWLAALGLGLTAVGAIAGAPGLLFAGVVVLLVTGLRTVWARFGLGGLVYERHLGTDRAVWGDEVPLDVVVWNRKLLPLAWVKADDFVSADAIVRERPVVHSDRPGQATLVNTWTLGPFERVVRHFHLVAAQRGTYRFDAVRLEVADLFARGNTVTEQRMQQTLVVRPRSVPVRRAGPERAPIGSRTARDSLFHDPALFAGVRPYQPGDPIRQIHWKATARTGSPVSKRFDPSRERELVIVLDIQTLEGPHWRLSYDEELVECLCVATASIARRAIADGAACGLTVAAFSGTSRRTVFLPPASGSTQLALIADTLGRLSSYPSAPFSTLLSGLAGRVPPGASIMTLSSRDPLSYLPALRRLARSGYHVEHLALGPSHRLWVQRARAAGLAATAARLEPDWQTSDALVLAG